MSEHDATSTDGPLDESVEELLAEMAAGKVLTDDGAITAEELEARKPKPLFGGSELLSDGEPADEDDEPAPELDPHKPVADSDAAPDTEVETPIDGDAAQDDGTSRNTESSQAAASAHVSPETPAHDEQKSRGDAQLPPLNGHREIPEGSVKVPGVIADEGNPDVTTANTPDGTERIGAQSLATSAPVGGSDGQGEPVPELSEQLEDLLSGESAAAAEEKDDLAVDEFLVDESAPGNAAPAPAPAPSMDLSGAIESLNEELENAAQPIDDNESLVVDTLQQADPPPAAPAPPEVAPTATETVQAASGAGGAQAIGQVHDAEEPAAAAMGDGEAATVDAQHGTDAPALVELKGNSILVRVKETAMRGGAAAAYQALSLASTPLKSASRGARDTIGWVGLWTAFLSVSVWFYVLVLHKPAPPYVPEAAIHIVEQTGEGEGEGHGSGGEHGKKPEAKKPESHAKADKPSASSHEKPAKKSSDHETPGGGHEKRPAKKADAHGKSAKKSEHGDH